MDNTVVERLGALKCQIQEFKFFFDINTIDLSDTIALYDHFPQQF